MRIVIVSAILVFVGSLIVGGVSPPLLQAAMPDSTITSVVLSKLAGYDQAYKGVDVRTHDGVVTLKGKVRSDEHRTMAETMAKQVPGVRDVNNDLTVVSSK